MKVVVPGALREEALRRFVRDADHRSARKRANYHVFLTEFGTNKAVTGIDVQLEILEVRSTRDPKHS